MSEPSTFTVDSHRGPEDTSTTAVVQESLQLRTMQARLRRDVLQAMECHFAPGDRGDLQTSVARWAARYLAQEPPHVRERLVETISAVFCGAMSAADAPLRCVLTRADGSPPPVCSEWERQVWSVHQTLRQATSVMRGFVLKAAERNCDACAPADDDCAICTSPLQNDVVCASCGEHKFHRACLTRWFEAQFPPPFTCPLCRAPIAVTDRGAGSGSR